MFWDCICRWNAIDHSCCVRIGIGKEVGEPVVCVVVLVADYEDRVGILICVGGQGRIDGIGR